ncbi:olfactory receptor-like protein DTMT [Amia ocellicauda]|uniref:olfactory receptor-like protein DTMT n=1 Tax=Amia ocellicauda TaxID=2972642 RepID=UPI003464C13A
MKYLYFAATLLGYLLILLANAVVIAVITFDRQLHEPMYIFICNLSLNGLYGSSAFYPMCMANLLSEIPTISRAGCLIQIFSLHTYGGFEYSVLALMAYDRYLSICHPLRYNSIMTPFKVTQLLVFVYICFEVVYQRFEMAKLPHSVLVIMSINCLLSPPLLNPITYGIKLQEIRKRILKLFSSTINNSVARVKRTEIKRRQTT